MRRSRMTFFEFVTNQRDYEAVVKAYDALDRNTLTAEQVSSDVLQYHHTGKLNITAFSLGNLQVGAQPTIERMEFTVELNLRSARSR